MKPILFLDMDGVLADFDSSPLFESNNRSAERGPSEMYEELFFETLPPIKGALSAVRELISSGCFESIQILTQPVRFTHYSYSEKAAWVWKWLPELGEHLTLTQDKTLLAGPNRILVDDNEQKWGKAWEGKGGKFFHFKSPAYPTSRHKQLWKGMVERLVQHAHETTQEE